MLHLADVEEPHAGQGQVRLRVEAAAVNPSDHKIRSGALPYMAPKSFPVVPGVEVAGVVDEVGEGVTGLAVGDEVLGWTQTGAYAEYAVASAVAAKPSPLSWETAAALPVALETSSRVLDLLALGRGETLLLHGAAGSVGGIAVQLAVARGITVVGTASPANHEYLRSLGAEPVAYGQGLADRVRAAAPQGIDAVFDAAGKGALPVSIELRGGTTERIVAIVDLPGAREAGVAFSSAVHSAAVVEKHVGLAVDGRLRVPIAGVFPLADAARAHELSEAGHVPGKLVLRP